MDIITSKMNFESGDNLFFTSDTHFGHDNIIKFCNRPFKDIKEMDDTIVSNWNRVVGKDDIVFHLGDFAFGGSQVWNNMISRLNGHIHLVVGNHDLKNIRQGYMGRFESVSTQLILNINNRLVYLNHYPFLCYAGSWRNPDAVVYQLFGHVHTRPHGDLSKVSDEEVKRILGLDAPRLAYLMPTQYDVGVDNNNFTPVSFKEVDRIIQENIKKSKK